MLGCAVVGVHLHVRHRVHPNCASAKSRFPRMVPASDDVLAAYGDYQAERADILGGDESGMVFVNLYHQPLGAAMRYRATKDFFDRLARECRFALRPHMLRHSAATNWVCVWAFPSTSSRNCWDTPTLASTTVYLHARDEDLRRAVEAVAAWACRQ